MSVAFDVISDLNIVDSDQFHWEQKATSLYCIVSGNISSDTSIVYRVLRKLSASYLGVFYIGGTSEFSDLYKVRYRHAELARLCKTLHNVAYLHNHVVIIDGVAIVGAVGWHSLRLPTDLISEIMSDKLRHQDYEYLKSTIERLQIHMDVKKIIVVTHCVPDIRLYWGQIPSNVDDGAPFTIILGTDTEHKITHWVYGQHPDNNAIELDGITYVNNSCHDRPNYSPKRIEV